MVERWLLQVEEMMVASVRKVLGESHAAYGDTTRNMWVLEWPGQTVICTSSIYWTAEVTDAMKTASGVEVTVSGSGTYLISLLILLLFLFLLLKRCSSINA